MNCRTQVALAAGIGYLLGRQRKLRWGLLLAAAAASGRLGRPGGLLQHGVRALGSLPEIGKLGELGAPLVEATKDAARAAVTGRIDSVSGRLRERADTLREPRKARKQEQRPEDREPVDEERERPPRRPRAAAREPEWDDEEENASPRERGERGERGDDRSARQGARQSPPPAEDYEHEDDEEEDKEPVAAGARTGGRPPVRRREG
ncbi:hypothetical protein ACFPIJ_16560 [Dactylosporangium cerinum]|uniref:Uncharacterized protein n=1 Tax=Dactylosporangium cerinum TaxID=1434730 RepID=A0ABV9VSR2_9ACTN